MRRALPLAAGLAVTLLAAPGHSRDKKDPQPAHVAATDPRSPAEERKTFHLPPGFDAELVAAEPDIHKPINLAFDDRGRLWVTDTVEYPFPAKGRRPRDTVKILEDFGPDGRARKVTTFGDGLNIPIGVLPLTNSPGRKGAAALVYSIPAIHRLTDTDGDGKADRREVVYEQYGSRDTHGMTSAFTWGFDGWVYACHGFSNTSTVKAKDGSAVTMQSGNTYRLRSDGSHVEQFTWGQVNPFGLCFDPLGNLYAADCHSQPIYQLLRGAYYPSFGKPHDGLGFGPTTIDHYQGSTAISGIVYYAADHFPASHHGTVYIGDVVTNRINQFRLTWHGSSPRATQEEFLRSDDPWFRPVDIKLGPDGALYVADFYNRIIGHYEVPLTHPGRDRERGRIWRIVYRGPDGKRKPLAPRGDWTRASIAELVQDLGHPNLTVRTLATNQLVKRGGPKVTSAVREALGSGSTVWQRVHGYWVLERCGALFNGVGLAARDKEFPVRVHALRILAERKKLSDEQLRLARAALKDPSMHVRRAAAEVLGRHPVWANLEPLVLSRDGIVPKETHLLHVTLMATRNVLRAHDHWRLPFTECPAWGEDFIAQASLGVPSAESARYLLEHLKGRNRADGEALRMVHHVARHGSAQTTEALLGFARGQRPDDLEHQAALVRSIERGSAERGARLSADARRWAAGVVGRLLASADARRWPGGLVGRLLAFVAAHRVQTGIDLAGAIKFTEMQDAVRKLLLSARATEGQRVAALNALSAIDATRHTALFGRLLAEAAQPITVREQAARLLARTNRPEAYEELLKGLHTAPARLQRVIATEMAGSAAGAEKLLHAVTAGKASARLLRERAVEVRLQQAKVPDLEKRLAKLTAGLPATDQRLQDLLRRRRDGFLTAKKDAALGRQIFEKNCANCHQLAGKGAKVGPQLDGVGVRGLDRLLEDVLDPNRNVDQAFRVTTLELKTGQVVAGLLLKEEGEVLVLADSQGKEVRVPRKNVAEKSVSQLSPMPANLADQVPEADFYNLLAYLLSQKPPGK